MCDAAACQSDEYYEHEIGMLCSVRTDYKVLGATYTHVTFNKSNVSKSII